MIKMIYKANETGNGTLDQTPVFVQEAAAREGDIIVKIVHRHGVMKGGQGAEVEIQDRGIMVGTGNNSRPSVFGVVASDSWLRLIYRYPQFVANNES